MLAEAILGYAPTQADHPWQCTRPAGGSKTTNKTKQIERALIQASSQRRYLIDCCLLIKRPVKALWGYASTGLTFRTRKRVKSYKSGLTKTIIPNSANKAGCKSFRSHHRDCALGGEEGDQAARSKERGR